MLENIGEQVASRLDELNGHKISAPVLKFYPNYIYCDLDHSRIFKVDKNGAITKANFEASSGQELLEKLYDWDFLICSEFVPKEPQTLYQASRDVARLTGYVAEGTLLDPDKFIYKVKVEKRQKIGDLAECIEFLQAYIDRARSQPKLIERDEEWASLKNYQEKVRKELENETEHSLFTKHDDGKYRRSHFDAETIAWIYKVASFGAKKYAPGNWKKCREQFRYLDALERHLTAYQGGEWLDGESGLPHLAHAAFNVLAELYVYERLQSEKAPDELQAGAFCANCDTFTRYVDLYIDDGWSVCQACYNKNNGIEGSNK